MKRTLLYTGIAAMVSLPFFSCGDGKPAENATHGTVKIGVDETFRLLLETEIFTFQSLYKDARVQATYGAEGDLLELLRNDSLRAIVIGRSLTPDEKAFFEAQKIVPKITPIAYDGVAFIVNRENPDSNISFSKLKELFTGNIAQWSGIRAGSSADSIRVVFDHPRSGNARYIMEQFGLKELPRNCFALNSNEAVVDYVEKNPHALGIIGSNWISEPEDTISHSFLKRIRVVGISSKDDPGATQGYFQPFQGYIASGEYPFKREVFYISRELGVRVGTGFASYVASDPGQRIVLKSGLVPASVPVRLIHINNE